MTIKALSWRLTLGLKSQGPTKRVWDGEKWGVALESREAWRRRGV